MPIKLTITAFRLSEGRSPSRGHARSYPELEEPASDQQQADPVDNQTDRQTQDCRHQDKQRKEATDSSGYLIRPECISGHRSDSSMENSPTVKWRSRKQIQEAQEKIEITEPYDADGLRVGRDPCGGGVPKRGERNGSDGEYSMHQQTRQSNP